MTGQGVVLDLLRYIGVTGFGPVANDQALNQPGLDDDDTNKALAAVNAALQEIQRYGPQAMKQGERSALFDAPTTLTLNPVTSAALSVTLPQSFSISNASAQFQGTYVPVDTYNSKPVFRKSGTDERFVYSVAFGAWTRTNTADYLGGFMLALSGNVAYPWLANWSSVNFGNGAGVAVFTVITPNAAVWEGCSILIPGDGEVNRILSVSGLTLALLRAYNGVSTAYVAATVYGDCALLGSEVAAVVEPLEASGNLKLTPARSIEEFNRYSLRSSYGGPVENPIAPILGTPSIYFAERRRDGRVLLRINPRAGTRLNVTFQAKLRAERIDTSALALDGGEDPAYEFTSLNQDEVESLLLPLARGKFAVHPSVKADARQLLMREYDTVMLRLTNGTAFEPAVHANHVEYI